MSSGMIERIDMVDYDVEFNKKDKLTISHYDFEKVYEMDEFEMVFKDGYHQPSEHSWRGCDCINTTPKGTYRMFIFEHVRLPIRLFYYHQGCVLYEDVDRYILGTAGGGRSASWRGWLTDYIPFRSISVWWRSVLDDGRTAKVERYCVIPKDVLPDVEEQVRD